MAVHCKRIRSVRIMNLVAASYLLKCLIIFQFHSCISNWDETNKCLIYFQTRPTFRRYIRIDSCLPHTCSANDVNLVVQAGKQVLDVLLLVTI